MFLVLFKCNILKKAPQIVRILHNNNCIGFTLFVFRTMNMSANIPCIVIIIHINCCFQRKTNHTHQMTMIMVMNIALTDLLNGLFSASFNAVNLFRDDYPDPETKVRCNPLQSPLRLN